MIPQELVAENGLFQPKLILAPKFLKLTPRPDPPEVGTRQLTLCPSSTNSLEPSPNLVSSEVLTRSRGGPATGRCGTRASEQAGKALRSQGHQCAHVM